MTSYCDNFRNFPLSSISSLDELEMKLALSGSPNLDDAFVFLAYETFIARSRIGTHLFVDALISKRFVHIKPEYIHALHCAYYGPSISEDDAITLSTVVDDECDRVDIYEPIPELATAITVMDVFNLVSRLLVSNYAMDTLRFIAEYGYVCIDKSTVLVSELRKHVTQLSKTDAKFAIIAPVLEKHLTEIYNSRTHLL